MSSEHIRRHGREVLFYVIMRAILRFLMRIAFRMQVEGKEAFQARGSSPGCKSLKWVGSHSCRMRLGSARPVHGKT